MVVLTIILAIAGLVAGAGGTYAFEQQRNKSKLTKQKKNWLRLKKKPKLVKKPRKKPRHA
jgi:hypothetical protein